MRRGIARVASGGLLLLVAGCRSGHAADVADAASSPSPVASSELRLMTFTAGKRIARAIAPKMTRMTCEGGIATASAGSTTKRFRVTKDALEVEAADGDASPR